MQTRFTLLLALFGLLLTDVAYSQIGRLDLSPLQKLEQNIARTDIVLEYSRPSMRGRTIFGKLVPFGQAWRTGANRNTTISFSEPVVIADQAVEAGKYAIITIPSKESWEFILYQETDNWDVPDKLKVEKIMVRAPMEVKQLPESLENLGIGIENFDNYTFNLSISWEQTKAIIPIKLTTRELMDEVILTQLAGPNYVDYYSAATYEFESGKNYGRGLEWIDQAMAISEELAWWDYRIKGYLLLGLGETAKAKACAEQGLVLAKEADNAYGIRELQSIIDRASN